MLKIVMMVVQVVKVGNIVLQLSNQGLFVRINWEDSVEVMLLSGWILNLVLWTLLEID